METKHALIIATAIVVGFVAHEFLNVVSATVNTYQISCYDNLSSEQGYGGNSWICDWHREVHCPRNRSYRYLPYGRQQLNPAKGLALLNLRINCSALHLGQLTLYLFNRQGTLYLDCLGSHADRLSR